MVTAATAALATPMVATPMVATPMVATPMALRNRFAVAPTHLSSLALRMRSRRAVRFCSATVRVYASFHACESPLGRK